MQNPKNLQYKWFSALAVAAALSAMPAQAQRGRPIVTKVNGLYTVLTDDGKRIRGTMFNGYNSPNNFEKAQSMPWADYPTKWKINSTRIYVRRRIGSGGVLDVGTYASLPEDKLEKILDYLVAQCAKHKMYAIIDYHYEKGDTKAMSSPDKDAYKFWSKYAARYKDKTHVFFELYNEPTYGYNLNLTQIEQMTRLFKHVRAIAPKTHLIVYSFGKYSYDGAITTTADNGPGIDYSNASVGYHTYALARSTGAARIKQGSAKYPMFMTEGGSQSLEHIQMLEASGTAWTGLGNLGQAGHENKVIWDGGFDGKLPPTSLHRTVKNEWTRADSRGLPTLFVTPQGRVNLLGRAQTLPNL